MRKFLLLLILLLFTLPASAQMSVVSAGSGASATVTVTSAGQFQLVFEEDDNWGVAQWYDLVNDPTMTTNLLLAYSVAGTSLPCFRQNGIGNIILYGDSDKSTWNYGSTTTGGCTPYPQTATITILGSSPSYVVIEVTANQQGDSNLLITQIYYIFPDGRIYLHQSIHATLAQNLNADNYVLEIGLNDPSGGSSTATTSGWIRASNSQNPYSYASPWENYLFAYWNSSDPSYPNFTKASILMVPGATAKALWASIGGQILHGWACGTGCGVQRWGYSTSNADTNLNLSAGQTVAWDWLFVLGTQNSAVMTNFINSTNAAPIANAYINGPVILSYLPYVNQGATNQYVEAEGEAGAWSVSGTTSSGGATSAAGSITTPAGLYTAPATVTPRQTQGGFQLLPNDHVFNTNIASLSVNTNNAAWMNVVNVGTGQPSNEYVGFPINYITPSTSAIQSMSFLYTSLNNGPFEVPIYPNALIECGWLDALNFNANRSFCDHHLLSQDTTTGISSDFYQYYNLGANAGCLTCNSQSGLKYNFYDYLLPANGSTDAAGMFLQPLILRLEEWENAVTNSGSISHALRMDFAQGFLCTCFIWPATQTASDGNTVPFGARIRLKSSFNISGYSAGAQILLTQMQQYGWIPADGGINWSSDTEQNVWPASFIAAASEVTNAGINFTITNTALTSNVATITATNTLAANNRVTISGTANGGGAFNVNDVILTSASGSQFTFGLTRANITSASDSGTAFSRLANYMEFVNEAPLQVTANQTCPVPASCGLTTHNREIVTFTRTSDSATASVDVALQGPAVNFPKDYLGIMAGSSSQQLTVLNNFGGYSCAMSPTVGALTSGCLFTPPGTVSSPTTTTITATSSANAAVSAQLNVTVYPPSAIRVIPSVSSNYTDTHGNLWTAFTGTDQPLTLGCCSVTGAGGVITDHALWDSQIGNSSVAHSDTRLNFTLPNGTYQITLNYGTSVGAGVEFNQLVANGSTLFSGDMNAAGLHMPFTQTFSGISVTNNQLNFTIFTNGGSSPGSPISSFSITQTGVTLSPIAPLKQGIMLMTKQHNGHDLKPVSAIR